MPSPAPAVRRGSTLPELAAALAVAAVLLAIALPAAQRRLDAAASAAARDDVAILLADARRRAQWRGERVAVLFDAAGAARVVTAAGDTVLVRAVAATHGVALASDRPTITYAPTGLGYGASNARITFRRGAASDTLFVSRLGRVRR